MLICFCIQVQGMKEKAIENLEVNSQRQSTPIGQEKRPNLGTPSPHLKKKRKSRAKLFDDSDQTDHQYPMQLCSPIQGPQSDDSADFQILDHSYNLNEPIKETATKVLNSSNILKMEKNEKQALLFELNGQLDRMCSLKEPGPSVLRSQSINMMGSKDVIAKVFLELKEQVPLLYDILYVLVSPMSSTSKNAQNIIAMMYAMGMYSRNKQCSLLQRLNTCAVLKNHANNEARIIFYTFSLDL